jgi:hypothetical protein
MLKSTLFFGNYFMHPAVQQAIALLVEEGKMPSVALTKAKLTESVPLPTIIAGITAYKNNPQCIDAPIKPQSQTPSTVDNSQLDRIEQKLDRLLSLLEKG